MPNVIVLLDSGNKISAVTETMEQALKVAMDVSKDGCTQHREDGSIIYFPLHRIACVRVEP